LHPCGHQASTGHAAPGGLPRRLTTAPRLDLARQLDRPPNNSNFSVMVVLPPSGCEMIAKVRRPAISSVRVLVNWVQLLPDGAVAGKRSRRPE